VAKVLTWTELEELSPTPEVHAEEIKPQAVETQSAVVSKTSIYWYLFYPDNIQYRYHDGMYKIEIEGKLIECPIQRGVVRTNIASAKDKMVAQGFTLMYEREENNE
jgi:hypothetical protein